MDTSTKPKGMSTFLKIFIGVIIAGFLMALFASDDKQPSTASIAAAKDSADKAMNAIRQKKQAAVDLEYLIERLQVGNTSMDSTFKSLASGTKAAVDVKLSFLKDWSNTYLEADSSTDPKVQELKEKFKSRLIAFQKKQLPLLRKEYADVMATELWRENIYVTCQGSGNSIINISGGLYASNKNIEDSQTLLQPRLKELRYYEVRYRWYKEADEFTYYRLESPKDELLF